MSEVSGGGDSPPESVAVKTPEVAAPVRLVTQEGLSAMQGIQVGQPEVADTGESAASLNAENAAATPQVALPNSEKQFAPPGTGGAQDEALVKERPSQVLTPQGISAIQGKR